ncbi:MAG TPA: arylesterase [Gallionella sp.]|nr:arylesterase [Gallionella sp.]
MTIPRNCSLRQFVLLVVAIVLVAACSAKPKEQPLPAGSQVLALGDSLTQGAGVTLEQAWPELLARKTGWVVVNGGVNGDTSEEALRRLPGLLDQQNPVLVLVTLGGNDMLRNIPRQQTIDNLERILALIKAHGAKAVLLATPSPSPMRAVFQNLAAPDFYRKVAEAQHVPLIGDAIADVLSNPGLKGDALHPNAEGHARLAEKIYKELRSIGYAG